MNTSRFSLQKPLSVLMALTLCVTTVACGSAPSETAGRQAGAPTAQNRAETKLPDGQYSVQQASYNDANGEYSLLLLGTPAGASSSLRTTDLQLARLSEADVKADKKPYVKIEGGKPAFYMSESFKIEYIHNVTETKADPQTGGQQTVVVRQESSFWTPFAGAIAGAAIGNMLFAPRYYVPPMYSPGGLSGYGGYGNSYSQAVGNYQQRNGGALPAATRNTQAFRSTGRLGSSSNSRVNNNSTRSTGSGFGSSTLRSDPSNSRSYDSSRSSGGFGSGRARVGGRRR